ncbi:hypothetical protein Poly30_21110 [Planctomycetes bacterium Poly30]|uniref:Uncharacterized protein n=1 Tax=Saltatorellus ferox TaxID=2528018 RepID=A0A518ER90_9BACT|nr:hypothetical protein Poly30_21110 [Planctomycetes bacterium Poly30]
MGPDGSVGGGSEADLEALAERLVELREEKRYVEGEIETVAARLAAAVGEGSKRMLGSVEIRVTAARPGLRILVEGDVPSAFLTAKPDRKLLLSHIRETGEVPLGVEVTEGRPTVFAKLIHPSSGS